MKLITFSLFGDNPLYCVGAVENARLAKEIYPDWVARFYVAQDVPEIIKKEFGTLKESIIEEAARMKYEMSTTDNNQTSKTNQDPTIENALKEIEDINEVIERLNKILNKSI